MDGKANTAPALAPCADYGQTNVRHALEATGGDPYGKAAYHVPKSVRRPAYTERRQERSDSQMEYIVDSGILIKCAPDVPEQLFERDGSE